MTGLTMNQSINQSVDESNDRYYGRGLAWSCRRRHIRTLYLHPGGENGYTSAGTVSVFSSCRIWIHGCRVRHTRLSWLGSRLFSRGNRIGSARTNCPVVGGKHFRRGYSGNPSCGIVPETQGMRCPIHFFFFLSLLFHFLTAPCSVGMSRESTRG